MFIQRMTLFNCCVFVYNQWRLFKVSIVLDFEPSRGMYWFYDVCVCFFNIKSYFQAKCFSKNVYNKYQILNRGLIIYKPLKVKFI